MAPLQSSSVELIVSVLFTWPAEFAPFTSAAFGLQAKSHRYAAEVFGLQMKFHYNAVVKNRGDSPYEQMSEPIRIDVLLEECSCCARRRRTKTRPTLKNSNVDRCVTMLFDFTLSHRITAGIK